MHCLVNIYIVSCGTTRNEHDSLFHVRQKSGTYTQLLSLSLSFSHPATMTADELDTSDAMAIDSPQVKQEEKPIVLSPEQERVRAKQEWIKQLRLKFCIRPEPEFKITENIIHPDGTLNQE